MTTHRNHAVASLTLLLVLIAIPALAAGGASRCAAGGAAVQPPAFSWVSESIQGSCRASCGDMGGIAEVQCEGNCTIVDQDCDLGTRGYVYCAATGTRVDCPVCHWCTAETPCPEGGSVSCGTWGYEYDQCQGGSGLCFAKCGSQFYFCPGHFGQIAC